MFPVIRRLEDVLPALEGRPEFVVKRREDYIAIDYIYADARSFDDPILRECRGLKFSLNGALMSRPLHKFFNFHEKPDELPDFSQDHMVMEKLDGSMIHPAILPGHRFVFMTRAGVSDQAKMALETAGRLPYGKRLIEFCKVAIESEYTPIFEYTSPANQIVVKYATDNLTLLAVRENETGDYWKQNLVEIAAKNWGFPCVRTYYDRSAQDMDAFVAHTRALPDTEGYVVCVGQWRGKMKADAYVASHRARSGLLWEKDVLRLVLEGKVDDVVGLLPKDEADRLKWWSMTVNVEVAACAGSAQGTVQAMKFRSPERRAFAANLAELPPAVRSWCFSIYDGRNPVEVVRSYGLKQCSSGTKAREFLSLLGVEPWTATPCDLEG